jgi:hypothetical protein
VTHVLDDPSGLSLRARRFLATRATREEAPSAEKHREHWRSQSLPEAAVELAAGFQERWGGLSLPPLRYYDGGPACLTADMPGRVDGVGWCIEAGQARVEVPYRYYVDEAGRFGVHNGPGRRQVPLHGSVEGWIESCALEDAAGSWDLVARRDGEVKELVTSWVPRVGPLTPVPEVQGLADSWWRGDGVMVWICAGAPALTAGAHAVVLAEASLYAVA